MFATGNGSEMIATNSREAGDFIFSESFLSGLDGDHCLPSLGVPATASLPGKWDPSTEAAQITSNSPAVYMDLRLRAPPNLQTFLFKSFRGKQQARNSCLSQAGENPQQNKCAIFCTPLWNFVHLWNRHNLTVIIVTLTLQLAAPCPFKCMGHVQYAFFAERRPVNLQADRKSRGSISGRD